MRVENRETALPAEMQGRWFVEDEPASILSVDGGEVTCFGALIAYGYKEVDVVDGTITVSLTFKPGPKRESAEVKVKCASKLAGIVTVNTQLFMGHHQGKLVAVENDPKQAGLFDAPDQPRPAPVASFNRSAPATGGQ